MKQILLIFIALILLGFIAPQQDQFTQEIQAWQAEMNKNFADSTHSPLSSEDRVDFKGLDFFSISKDYRFEADFKRVENADTILFKTTTKRTPKYFAFGTANFTFNGKQYELTIYKSVRLMNVEAYKDYLFLPYTDASNGNGSYGGGRYLDPQMPKDGKIVLDFNKSYNPYCVYNKKYSCPIPPIQNDLDFEVKAGVKDWK